MVIYDFMGWMYLFAINGYKQRNTFSGLKTNIALRRSRHCNWKSSVVDVILNDFAGKFIYSIDLMIFDYKMIFMGKSSTWLVASTPPKNMKVNWDDYSQYNIYNGK